MTTGQTAQPDKEHRATAGVPPAVISEQDRVAAVLHHLFGPDRIAEWDDLSGDTRAGWLAHANRVITAYREESVLRLELTVEAVRDSAMDGDTAYDGVTDADVHDAMELIFTDVLRGPYERVLTVFEVLCSEVATQALDIRDRRIRAAAASPGNEES